jgi:RNA polymerase sigma-70 factor (ECF subfamily)
MDELDAIERCRHDDKNAFAAVVQQYQAQILALCLRMTGNREDASDVAQQTFVQAFGHLDRYDPHQPFRPWLYKIATNQCISFLRRQGRQAAPVPDEVLEQVSDPEDGAPTLVEAAADRQEVRAAVATLPEPYRTAVVLHYFEGLSYQEMARQTDLPIGTISTHLYRAKNLLRRVLPAKEVGSHDTYHKRSASGVLGR